MSLGVANLVAFCPGRAHSLVDISFHGTGTKKGRVGGQLRRDMPGPERCLVPWEATSCCEMLETALFPFHVLMPCGQRWYGVTSKSYSSKDRSQTELSTPSTTWASHPPTKHVTHVLPPETAIIDIWPGLL